ncbi:MAG: glycosyltransferase family 87 protein [Candidatus Obscuribacterales bacterium]|nr:glycosyltransferase family 87 protein [Candidatus Obscuribacterales bacterium]
MRELFFHSIPGIAAILKGRRLRAGLWLSAAVSIKVIPALLLAFPLWRRDWRMLFGSAVGLMTCLIVVPVIVFGPAKTTTMYSSFYHHIIIAGIRGSKIGRCARELTAITTTDSNSPMVIIHNIMHPNRNTRPKVASPIVRGIHWVIAFLMLALSLVLSGWRGRWYSGRVEATISEVAFMCALIPLMFITTPVFHPHYVSMALPLVMIILVILWERYPYGQTPFTWRFVFGFVTVSHILTAIDMGPFLYLREFGLVLFSTVTLWLGSLRAIKQIALVPNISGTENLEAGSKKYRKDRVYSTGR